MVSSPTTEAETTASLLLTLAAAAGAAAGWGGARLADSLVREAFFLGHEFTFEVERLRVGRAGKRKLEGERGRRRRSRLNCHFFREQIRL